tara:strand:+ start:607 stop:921 length:315 start_codon:yes stop_codon:yes gene_type:complete
MNVQKSKIKNILKKEGCRLSPESWDGINRAVESLIISMSNNVKSDGMKTLMAKHTVVSNKTKVTTSSKCKRCCNIKDTYIKWAKQMQTFCYEKAYVLSKKLGGK